MKKLSTYLIKKSEIEKLFGLKDAISAVEKVFKLYAKGKTQMPPKIYIDFKKGDLRIMPASIPPLNAAGLKVVNVHPNNKFLPTVMALIILVDPETGFPLVVMDGKYITDLRTGAAGALAAKYLARSDSKIAGFVGAGRQAETQLEGLMTVFPELKKIFVYDISQEKTKKFCEKYSKKYNLEAVPTDSVKIAVQDSDVVVTTTPSRKPIVKANYVKPGTHINAIGADAAGKQELESILAKKSKIVIDNWAQASHSGEINVPLTKGIIKKKDIYGELGEILIGKKKGRQNQKEITIFDSTGLAIQDIACAISVYNKITSDKKLEKSLKKIMFLDN